MVDRDLALRQKWTGDHERHKDGRLGRDSGPVGGVGTLHKSDTLLPAVMWFGRSGAVTHHLGHWFRERPLSESNRDVQEEA